jgi:hypothetical protein
MINGPIDARKYSFEFGEPALSRAELEGKLLEETRNSASTPRIDRYINEGASGTSVASDGTTPLHGAVLNGTHKSVLHLIQVNKNLVHAVNKYGQTPLMLARSLPESDNKTKIIKILGANGATVTSSSSSKPANTRATGRDGTRTNHYHQPKPTDTQYDRLAQMITDYSRVSSRPDSPDITERIPDSTSDSPRKTFNDWREDNPHGYTGQVLAAMEDFDSPGWCHVCNTLGCRHFEKDSQGRTRRRSPGSDL